MDAVAVDAWLLKLPLERPYRLAFGPVAELDTVLVRVTLASGDAGWGEATLLTGYTDETVAGTWTKVLEFLGEPPSRLAALLDGHDASHPFLTTAFRTAFEMAAGSPLLEVGGSREAPVRVPVLGLLQGEGSGALESEVDRLVDAGYGTLKLKVGFDAAADARNVEVAQRRLAGRARLRIDANQGYRVADACAFVRGIATECIELFEQPCAAGDWDSHLAVAEIARVRGLPLMLDESIYSLNEIERAAALDAARFIKVKLMKFNSLARLDAAIARIGELGMTAVLGNGVANELGCWMEACVASRRIDNAGEMNGFLKPRDKLFVQPLRFAHGAIELVAGETPEIDLDKLSSLALARASQYPSRGRSQPPADSIPKQLPVEAP